jgi:aldehyde:ferredoxin oxidoreductase
MENYGWAGKILRVDLSGKLRVEENDEDFYRKFVGGRALSLYYLLKQKVKDAFSPRAVIVFAVSCLTGAPIPGASRFTVAGKSPLTGTYGEAEAGGSFGPEMKYAGWDAIVISGKVKHPVYLWIKDDDVQILDAEKLWGLSTLEAEERMIKETDKNAKAVSIGKAGELLVRYACIISQGRHAAGRSGLGAVLGSKKIKGICVLGTKKMKIRNPDKLRKLSRWFSGNFRKNLDAFGLHKIGTSKYLLSLNAVNALPTLNFRRRFFDKGEEISGERMGEYVVAREGCYACPIRCKRRVKMDGNDPRYGAPEYEALASLGSLCGNSQLESIVKGNELCNKYGMDVISCGASIAFAIECSEKGMIDERIKWGDSKAILKLIQMIGEREGIGDLLAEGVKRASEKIGGKEFALHVKGKEIPMHEPRWKQCVGLGYGVSPTGADHLQAQHDPLFEKEEYVKQALPLGAKIFPSMDLSAEKIRFWANLQKWFSLANCLDLCLFTLSPGRVWKMSYIPAMVSAVTGWEVSLDELLVVGERGITMARLYNVREGFSKKDDFLPERFYDGIGREKYEGALAEYYKLMGWDSKGIPSPARLRKLGIGK